MTDERLFAMDTDGNPHGIAPFYTGRVADGRQLLMGPDYDGMLLLWFDDGGVLLEAETLPIPRERGDQGSSYEERAIRRMVEWQREAGYRPGRIRVKHFWLDEPFRAGIRLLPEWAIEFLCDPYLFPTEEERQETQDYLDEWQAKGKFVLHWGESNYYIGENCAVS